MIRLNIDGRDVLIPDQLLASAVTDHMPGFLTGKEPAQGKMAALKAGLKALIPMMLGLLHKNITESQSGMEAPDIRCPDARANMIMYAANYLTRVGLAEAGNQIFTAEGSTNEQGAFLVSGFSATAPTLVSTGRSGSDVHAGRERVAV